MTGPQFVAALRPRVSVPFNFIIPKMPQGHAPVIDICLHIGRGQWIRFGLKDCDQAQLDFIAARLA